MKPPKGFIWEQRDAGKLKCKNCGEIIQAVTADLHICEVDE